MIAALKGRIFEKNEGKILLDVNGVVYELNVSMITFSKNDAELFYITEIIKENEYTLYGFCDRSEQHLFNSLIKLNGVGPKAALAICSTYTPHEFSNIVNSNDINALKKVPGIGPKSAKRIIMEMGGFEAGTQNPSAAQAVAALENLGFKKADILKALQGLDGSVEEMIKGALKRLSR